MGLSLVFFLVYIFNESRRTQVSSNGATRGCSVWCPLSPCRYAFPMNVVIREIPSSSYLITHIKPSRHFFNIFSDINLESCCKQNLKSQENKTYRNTTISRPPPTYKTRKIRITWPMNQTILTIPTQMTNASASTTMTLIRLAGQGSADAIPIGFPTASLRPTKIGNGVKR